ncbi:MAG: hypothetical protein EPN68_13275, partial [Rhodanobacter sp.]
MNTTSATPSPTSLRRMHSRNRRGQRGVVALEFAMIFLLGFLPLLLLTFSGAMVFAAKQSLTLAAANGARAALHYNTTNDGNLTSACSTALRSMNWLFALPNGSAPSECPSGSSSISNSDGTATITANHNCTVVGTAAGATCVKVTTEYNYDKGPLILGTGKLYGWLMNGPLQSTAIIQIYNTQG